MNTHPSSPVSDRRQRLALLARATRDELAAAWAALPVPPAITDIRPAEAGMIMVQGRTGGDGAPFNLGEATVSRAAVRLGETIIGLSYALGRDIAKARLAAAFDALAQTPEGSAPVATLLARIAARLAAERDEKARRAAATRVDFFTLVRGSNL